MENIACNFRAPSEMALRQKLTFKVKSNPYSFLSIFYETITLIQFSLYNLSFNVFKKQANETCSNFLLETLE